MYLTSPIYIYIFIHLFSWNPPKKAAIIYSILAFHCAPAGFQIHALETSCSEAMRENMPPKRHNGLRPLRYDLNCLRKSRNICLVRKITSAISTKQYTIFISHGTANYHDIYNFQAHSSQACHNSFVLFVFLICCPCNTIHPTPWCSRVFFP